jgi:hypothetical protein
MNLIDESTPLTKNGAPRKFVITSKSSSPSQQSPEQRKKPVKRRSQEFTLQARNELDLLNTLVTPEPMKQQLNGFVRDTLNMRKMTRVLIAFYIADSQFFTVCDPMAWQKGVKMGEEWPIDDNKLCVDVRQFEDKYPMIRGVLNHMKTDMTSPMHYIITRRRFTMECQPNPEDKSFMRRNFNYELCGHYYNILFDAGQSVPMYELK